MLNEYSQEFLVAVRRDSRRHDPRPAVGQLPLPRLGPQHPEADRAALPERRPAGLRRLARRPACPRTSPSSESTARRRVRAGRRRGPRHPDATTTPCEPSTATTSSAPTVRDRRCDDSSASAASRPTSRCRTSAASRARSSRTSTASTCATSATSSATPTSSPRATSPSSGRSSTRRPSGRTRSTTRCSSGCGRRCPLGESIKREAWVALSVRHTGDVVPGDGRVLLAGEAGGFMSPTLGRGHLLRAQHRPPGRHRDRRGRTRRGPRRLPQADAPTSRATSRASCSGCRSWSRAPGKYLAGFVPTPIVSRITKGL